MLTVEKASLASGLEAKDGEMEGMQQEYSNVQTQLLLCQERVSQLQSELLQVHHPHTHIHTYTHTISAHTCAICTSGVASCATWLLIRNGGMFGSYVAV